MNEKKEYQLVSSAEIYKMSRTFVPGEVESVENHEEML